MCRLVLWRFLTGYIANTYGVRPYPFIWSIGFSIMGLLLSVLFVKDTRLHVGQESTQQFLYSKYFLNTSFTINPLAELHKQVWSIILMTVWFGGYYPFITQ
jgi:hypothetical protein